MKLYEKIAALRKAAGLTQERLGALLNVSPQAVSKWENDESLPDLALIPALCGALRVSADELLDIPHQPVQKGKALLRADTVHIAAPAGVTLTITGEAAVRAVQAAEAAPLLALLTDDAALCVLRVLGFSAADEAELAERCGLETAALREVLFRLMKQEIVQCTADGYVLGAGAYLVYGALAAAWLASDAGRTEITTITTSYTS